MHTTRTIKSSIKCFRDFWKKSKNQRTSKRSEKGISLIPSNHFMPVAGRQMGKIQVYQKWFGIIKQLLPLSDVTWRFVNPRQVILPSGFHNLYMIYKYWVDAKLNTFLTWVKGHASVTDCKDLTNAGLINIKACAKFWRIPSIRFLRYWAETYSEIKCHNVVNNLKILSLIKFYLYFTIIYLCLKYESNP